MKDNIKLGETYTFANCHVLPVSGDIKASGGIFAYLNFYDTTGGIVKSGGRTRRPARPTLEDLKAIGVTI